MDLVIDVLSLICLVAGAALCIIGTVGILRLPDVFSRMHGAGIVDTGGAGLILLGLILQSGWTIVTVKLFLIAVFLLYTSPTTTHALARAALHADALPPSQKQDQENEDGRAEP